MAGNEPPVVPRPRGNHPSVREIHKNAWLKRQSPGDKKGTAFSKKSEKFWVVFCVHDDVEALLEFYSEPKMGSIHKPLTAISLNSCLHVSPSIMGQDNEYQFAVTLQTEVIRLVAANWEQMIEWVESLQGKLREMNILSPKDNLYSKLPEVNKLATVASTRDPNSPLPPTPSALAAAAERQRTHNHNQSNRTESQLRSETPSSRNQSQPSDTSSRLTANGNSERERPPRASSQHSSTPESHSDPPTATPSSQSRSGEESQEGPAPPTKPKPQINVKLKVDVNNVHRSSSGNVIQSQQRHHFTTGPLPSTSTTVVVIGNGDMRIHNNSSDSSSTQRGDGRSCTASVVVSCSQNVLTSSQQTAAGADPRAKSPFSEETSGDTGNAEVGGSSQENGSQSNANPCVSRVSVNYTEVQFIKPTPKSRQRQGVIGAAISNGTSSSTPATEPEPLLAVPKRTAVTKTVKSTSSENIYEHIYIPDRNGVKPIVTNSNQAKNHSQTSNEVDGRSSSGRVYRSASQRSPEEEVASGSGRDFHARRIIKGNNSGSSQRSSSLGRIEHPSSSNRAEVSRDSHDVSRRNGNRNRQPSETTRAIGNSTFFENNATSSQLQGSPIDALIGCRSGEYKLRRDDYLIRMTGNGGENDNQSSDSSQSSEPYENTKVQPNGARVPLKEQQVMHLQMEINHPGGVRVILRKKDCLSSIAFVDYLGAVWVAGWKQTQFPVLYYAFHVGDQILKVAGVTVQSSIEASRAIKMVSSLQVEFIIRRLPYGKVYALKRSRDGEPLGLVAEGGSGEISEVLQDGLAARYGLPPKGLSVDGQAPCNWYLTEVNNRPLSLMSKENEVKDRLNAVGKEISILVQPADLVKHLRKNLKSFKGFKDYVVG